MNGEALYLSFSVRLRKYVNLTIDYCTEIINYFPLFPTAYSLKKCTEIINSCPLLPTPYPLKKCTEIINSFSLPPTP